MEIAVLEMLLGYLHDDVTEVSAGNACTKLFLKNAKMQSRDGAKNSFTSLRLGASEQMNRQPLQARRASEWIVELICAAFWYSLNDEAKIISRGAAGKKKKLRALSGSA
ncbi:MAG: hypothetical protein HON04_02490 [Planctomicrobium sp.]|jgi:hypothetical protein|nr:hypothetical protein [Planctomicrobium sp.]